MERQVCWFLFVQERGKKEKGNLSFEPKATSSKMEQKGTPFEGKESAGENRIKTSDSKE
jgi:hypothetical protein